MIEARLTEFQRLDELYWHQRSRIQWLQAGDRNTRFFHTSALIRKRRNTISQIVDGTGALCYAQEEIAMVLIDFFTHQFSAVPVSPPDDQLLASLPKIPREGNDSLKALPPDDEIRHVFFVMDPWKLPGPDDLLLASFRDVGLPWVKTP